MRQRAQWSFTTALVRHGGQPYTMGTGRAYCASTCYAHVGAKGLRWEKRSLTCGRGTKSRSMRVSAIPKRSASTTRRNRKRRVQISADPPPAAWEPGGGGGGGMAIELLARTASNGARDRSESAAVR